MDFRIDWVIESVSIDPHTSLNFRIYLLLLNGRFETAVRAVLQDRSAARRRSAVDRGRRLSMVHLSSRSRR